METPFQTLSQYKKGDYSPGVYFVTELLWFLIGSPLIKCSIMPFSSVRNAVLRVFGAKIGKGVVIKPGVKIKCPWKLNIGDHSWIGEDVWIDNLATVSIGDNTCISQGVYFCTGNHNWKVSTFDLMTSPITVDSHTWIAAKSVIGPGVTIKKGALVALGSVVSDDVEAGVIVKGNPAIQVGVR